jgi:transketolase
MSGMASYTPGMEISGGSLGQGLPIGVGMALGLKQKKNLAFIYNSMSDGELDEGSTWEAAMGAAHQLDNLICLVDINNQQADGPSSQGAGLRAPGRQMGRLRLVRAARRRQRPAGRAGCLRRRAHLTEPKPRVILFDTLMGKGVPFLERARRTTSSASIRPSGSRPWPCWMPRGRKPLKVPPKEPAHERPRR